MTQAQEIEVKFAGLTEKQAAAMPRRSLPSEGLLDDATKAKMPKMISTDAHVMEPDELWKELTPRLQDGLPKVPFRIDRKSTRLNSSH